MVGSDEHHLFVTNKVLVGAAAVIIFALTAMVWTVNNHRIGILEDWRRTVEITIPLLTEKVKNLEKQIQQLEDDLKKRNGQ